MKNKLSLSAAVTFTLIGFIFQQVGRQNDQSDQKFRVETDLLGEKKVPVDAYYGIQTARAIDNFQISGMTISHYPALLRSMALVKAAAAKANVDVGKMDATTRDAILKACEAIADGRFHDQFRVDLYQGGAGTSINMNANEVIANVALKLAGHELGDYDRIEPHDDVNMSQSTNDFYPTALKVAMVSENDALVAELKKLASDFRKKGNEFLRVIKIGRTEMQDAVPMTVGQEFHAFAAALETEVASLQHAVKQMFRLNMGGTAIGTGLNAPPGFAERVAMHLSKLTGKTFSPADDLIASTWDQQAFVGYSSALKSLAVKLSKIASDLILLSSGPRAGLGEINLPPVQPGSSIMPGKINPVIPELVNLVAFRVIGNDLTVTLAAQHGQLQLNAYEPLEAIAIFESQRLLTNTMKTLRIKCASGITLNEKVLESHIQNTIGIVTALNPVIGYDRATELAAEAHQSGQGILEIVREKNILTEQQINKLLDPKNLTGLDPEKYKRQDQK